MKKKFRKATAVLLAVILTLGVFTIIPFGASAAEATQDSVGAANSYAQSYAARNALPFRAIIDSQPVGDANGDNRIDVNNVTAIQRYFAEYEDFTPAQKAAADTDGNGVADINDATHLQRYLAEYDVRFG